MCEDTQPLVCIKRLQSSGTRYLADWGGGYQILEEFAASIVRVVQEVKCGIAVCFLGKGLNILWWLHYFCKVSCH